jgi:hypothetical protein
MIADLMAHRFLGATLSVLYDSGKEKCLNHNVRKSTLSHKNRTF